MDKEACFHCLRKRADKSECNFHYVFRFETDFKMFVLNDLVLPGPSKSRRKSIDDEAIFCHACYQIASKKFKFFQVNQYYSPEKAKTKSGGRSGADKANDNEVRDCVICLKPLLGKSDNTRKLRQLRSLTEVQKANLLQIGIILSAEDKEIHSVCRIRKPDPTARNESMTVSGDPKIDETESAQKEVVYSSGLTAGPTDSSVEVEDQNIHSIDTKFLQLQEQCYSALLIHVRVLLLEKQQPCLHSTLTNVFLSDFEETLLREDCVSHEIDRNVIRNFLKYRLKRDLGDDISVKLVGKIILYVSSDFDFERYCVSSLLEKDEKQHQEYEEISKELTSVVMDKSEAKKLLHYTVLHLKDLAEESKDPCSTYAMYPDILSSISTEDLLFGKKVNLKYPDHNKRAVMIKQLFHPQFWILLWFLTTNKHSRDWKQFNEGIDWDEPYLPQNPAESKDKIGATLQLGSQILYFIDKHNSHPLPMMMSDMVMHTSPQRLMHFLNSLNICASPNAFRRMRGAVASIVQRHLDNGIIDGARDDVLGLIHCDNKEKYGKGGASGKGNLCQVLAVSYMQSQPNDPKMQLPKEENEEQEKQFDSFPSTPQNETFTEQAGNSVHSLNSEVSIEIPSSSLEHLIVGNISYEDEPSDETGSESCNFSKDGESSSISEITVAEIHSTPVKRKTDYAIETGRTPILTPREKRPRSEKPEVRHTAIPAYFPPIQQLPRQTVEFEFDDFLMNKSDNGIIKQFLTKYFVYAQQRIFGSSAMKEKPSGDTVEDAHDESLAESLYCLETDITSSEEYKWHQTVPNFKDKLRWEYEENEKTAYVYLRSIPAKPDAKDTLKYALDEMVELFMVKRKLKEIVVCGDGLTMSQFYKIRDDFPSTYENVYFILGHWHYVVAILRAWLDKYKSAGVQPILELFYSSGLIEGTFTKVTTHWKQVHYFICNLFETLTRLLISSFEKYLEITDEENIEILGNQWIIFCQKVRSSLQELHSEYIPSFSFNESDLLTGTTPELRFSLHQNAIYKLFEENIYDSLRHFFDTASDKDETFKLWFNMWSDLLPYIFGYIAIRTGDYDLRIASLKLGLIHSLVSSMSMYPNLIMRQLAEEKRYPAYLKEILRHAWVSSLSDGCLHNLATDEFHERTMSLELELFIPKNASVQLIETISDYQIYGSKMRANFMHGFTNLCSTKSFPGYSVVEKMRDETMIQRMLGKLAECSPFLVACRALKQPFTEKIPSPSVKMFLLNSPYLGKEKLRGIIQQRYIRSNACCQPIPRTRVLKMEKYGTNQGKKKQEKKKEDIAKHGLGILSTIIAYADASLLKNIPGLELSQYPSLFAEINGEPNLQQGKSTYRHQLMKRYKSNNLCSSFYSSTVKQDTAIIVDALQRLNVAPTASQQIFHTYANMFMTNLIKPLFTEAQEVHLIFDQPTDCVVNIKQSTQEKRDAKLVSDIQVPDEITDNTPLPKISEWQTALGNRSYKLKIIAYLVSKIMELGSSLIQSDDCLYLAGSALLKSTCLRITANEVLEDTVLRSNHSEADTRMIFHASATGKKRTIILSTDTDILAILLLNSNELLAAGKEIMWRFETRTTLSLRAMVTAIKEDTNTGISQLVKQGFDVPALIGCLLPLCGCDQIPQPRSFGPASVLDTFFKNCLFIQGDNGDQGLMHLDSQSLSLKKGYSAYCRFILAAFVMKFPRILRSSPQDILLDHGSFAPALLFLRRKIWHLTFKSQNLVPEFSEVCKQAQRISYLLGIWKHATTGIMTTFSPLEFGWLADGKLDWGQSCDKSIHTLVTIGCNCSGGKSGQGCKTNQCRCRKDESRRSCNHYMCTCKGCQYNEESLLDTAPDAGSDIEIENVDGSDNDDSD